MKSNTPIKITVFRPDGTEMQSKNGSSYDRLTFVSSKSSKDLLNSIDQTKIRQVFSDLPELRSGLTPEDFATVEISSTDLTQLATVSEATSLCLYSNGNRIGISDAFSIPTEFLVSARALIHGYAKHSQESHLTTEYAVDVFLLTGE